MKNKIMSIVEQQYKNPNLTTVNVGDDVIISTIIMEGQGDKAKQRIQKFEGVVIKLHGEGVNRTINVRKVSYGVGVERTFLLNSPLIAKIEVKNSNKVRRSKLYFLRNLTGKKARLQKK